MQRSDGFLDPQPDTGTNCEDVIYTLPIQQQTNINIYICTGLMNGAHGHASMLYEGGDGAGRQIFSLVDDLKYARGSSFLLRS
jgi:hypothetical protein